MTLISTAVELRALVASITLRFGVPLRLSVVAPGDTWPGPAMEPLWRTNEDHFVVLRFYAQPRDDGAATWLGGDHLAFTLPASREFVLETARRLVHSSMAHEIDESFYVGGVRVFDPHGVVAEERS